MAVKLMLEKYEQPTGFYLATRIREAVTHAFTMSFKRT
jgi:hypothetical protein